MADAPAEIALSMPSRHALIACATGSSKTKTLQLPAGQLSANGVPAVVAGTKGDLSAQLLAGVRKSSAFTSCSRSATAVLGCKTSRSLSGTASRR